MLVCVPQIAARCAHRMVSSKHALAAARARQVAGAGWWANCGHGAGAGQEWPVPRARLRRSAPSGVRVGAARGSVASAPLVGGGGAVTLCARIGTDYISGIWVVQNRFCNSSGSWGVDIYIFLLSIMIFHSTTHHNISSIATLALLIWAYRGRDAHGRASCGLCAVRSAPGRVGRGRCAGPRGRQHDLLLCHPGTRTPASAPHATPQQHTPPP